jgi:hypothetical protein
VGHLHHQLQAVGAGEPVGEALVPGRLQGGVHLLEAAEQGEQRAGVDARRALAGQLDEVAAQQAQQPAGQVGPRRQVSGAVAAGRPGHHRVTQAGDEAQDLLARHRVLPEPLPGAGHAARGLVEERREPGVEPGDAHSSSPSRPPRFTPCLSIRRYSVVRSTLAIRAALDMLPLARWTRRLR